MKAIALLLLVTQSPRIPLALDVWGGAMCFNAGAPGSCFLTQQIGFDFAYGDVHVGVLEGPPTSAVGADRSVILEQLSNHDGGVVRGGVNLGVQGGTRLYTVLHRGRLVLRLGARAGFDFTAVFWAEPYPYGNVLLPSLLFTAGPTASLGFGGRWSLIGRLAAGVSVIGLGSEFGPVVAGAVDVRLGARLAF